MHRAPRRRAAVDAPFEALARSMVEAPVASLQEALAGGLEEVGRRLGADRAALWDVSGEARRVTLLQLWASEGRGRSTGPIDPDALPWLVAQLAARRPVAFRSVADLPREAALERRWFARHGPRSAAVVPLVVGEQTVAALAVGTLRRERRWGAAALALLARAAVALSPGIVRLRAHAAALATEARLAGILEAGPDGILLLEPSGRIELANGRAVAILGRTRQDLQGRRLQDVLSPGPGPDRPAGGAIEALLARTEPLALVALRGDGTSAPVEVTLRPVPAPGQALLCCGLRDASEDRRARDEAAELRDEIALRGRTAMLAEMGSGIAHELNQPLTAILSNAETAVRLLRDRRGETVPLREALHDVVHETRRAAQILARLRDMLRRRPPERAPVDVAALLRGVAARFREESVVQAIRVVLEVEHGLPPVLGDRVQLEQVMTNLVLNAFEALGRGTALPRTVALGARRGTAGGVNVSVRDTGPGLSDEALARAFDAFFTTKPRGLGVGLPISRSIVEAHGGRLLARNDAERGATFEFDLPAAPARAAGNQRRRRA